MICFAEACKYVSHSLTHPSPTSEGTMADLKKWLNKDPPEAEDEGYDNEELVLTSSGWISYSQPHKKRV